MYYLRARLFPAILTCIPFFVFLNEVIAPKYNEALKSIYDIISFLATFGIAAAGVFLGILLNRLIAKEIFEKIYFKDELKLPTTEYLLWSDTFFEKSIKEKIRQKIKEKFGIALMNEEEEKTDEIRSRKQITTAVSQIRNYLRTNKLLLQHNIEYGFFRNLIGGSLLASLISMGLLIAGIFQQNLLFQQLGILGMAIYCIPVILSKYLLKRFGSYYSKILYEQFLTT